MMHMIRRVRAPTPLHTFGERGCDVRVLRMGGSVMRTSNVVGIIQKSRTESRNLKGWSLEVEVFEGNWVPGSERGENLLRGGRARLIVKRE
jgi:hypothetical protein